MNTVAIPDLVIGETREIEILPSGLSSGFASRNYRLCMALTPKSPTLIEILFGPSQYDGGRGSWLVTIPSTEVAKLSGSEVFVGIWDVAATKPLEPMFRLTLGSVPSPLP